MGRIKTFKDYTLMINGKIGQIYNNQYFLKRKVKGVRSISFEQSIPLRPGDEINAYILLLEKHEPKKIGRGAPQNNPEWMKQHSPSYSERNSKEHEKASKIELLIKNDVKGTWGELPTGKIPYFNSKEKPPQFKGSIFNPNKIFKKP